MGALEDEQGRTRRGGGRLTARAQDRVRGAAGLGQGDKPVDLLLGWAAFAPLVVAGLGAWWLRGDVLLTLSLIAVDAWAGGLLCFFAGVRRGLTFSERRGGAWGEVATFLLLFFVGVAGIALAQPLLLALGFVGAGVADLLAARRGEAPAYFARLRPAQCAVAAVALVSVAVRLA